MNWEKVKAKISGGSSIDPYCADGNCLNCGQWFCVIEREERKVRKGICTNCGQGIELIYRRLVVNEAPLICPYCKHDPVYIERDPGQSIFVIEFNSKAGKPIVQRHPCDLEYEKRAILKAKAGKEVAQ